MNAKARARELRRERERAASTISKAVAGGKLLALGHGGPLRIRRPTYIDPGSGLAQATWIVRDVPGPDGPVSELSSVGGLTCLQQGVIALLAAEVSAGNLSLIEAQGATSSESTWATAIDRAVQMAGASLELARQVEFPQPQGDEKEGQGEKGAASDSAPANPETEGTPNDGRKPRPGEVARSSD